MSIRMQRLLGLAWTLALVGFVLAPAAKAHGGDEMAVQGLKQEPARALAQQAIAELKIRGDTKDAAARLDAALESKDKSGIDVKMLNSAMKTLDDGNPGGAIPLLDQALSRPLGADRGKSLHEAGREFEPATGAQEVVAIVLGAVLLAGGLFLLINGRRRAA